METETALLPKAALDPAKTDAQTEKLIAAHPTEWFRDIIERLVNAQPLVPNTAQEIAASIAHAASLSPPSPLPGARATLNRSATVRKWSMPMAGGLAHGLLPDYHSFRGTE